MSLERLPPIGSGATGPMGPAGPAGATGAPGPPGLEGEPGESEVGPRGATGAAGPTGATGPTGAPGPIGPPGLELDHDLPEFIIGQALPTDLYEINQIPNIRGDLLVSGGTTAHPVWTRLPNPTFASVLATFGGGPISDPFWATAGDEVEVTARVHVRQDGTLIGTRRAIDFLTGPNVRLTVTDDIVDEEVQVLIAATVNPVPGLDGVDGEDGFGLPGPAGAAGAAGATGAAGAAGARGAPGVDGEDGAEAFSLPGPAGPTGATGATGGTGPSGPAGAAGAPGPPGLDADEALGDTIFLIDGTGTGNVSGSGVAGQVTVWGGPTTLTGDPDFTWDSASQFLALGVGDAAPAAGLTVFGASQAQATMALTASLAGSAGPRIQLRASRGTPAVPTGLSSGDIVGTLQARGYDGITYASVAQIRILTTEAYSSSSNHGSFMDFSTVPNAAGAVVVALKIDQNADLLTQVSKTGATRLLGFSNTSNTASSQAQLDTAVGGTSAGDPFHTFTIPSGASWSLGVDNSDADKFKVSRGLALGTTDSMTIDTTDTVMFTGSVGVRTVPYVWPASQGGASTVLQNDGSGGLSWMSAGAAGMVGPTGPPGIDGSEADEPLFHPGVPGLTGPAGAVGAAGATGPAGAAGAMGPMGMDGEGSDEFMPFGFQNVSMRLTQIADLSNIATGDLLEVNAAGVWSRVAIGAANSAFRSTGAIGLWSVGILDNNARVAVDIDGGGVIGTRRTLSLIGGTNISLSAVDTSSPDQVAVTINATSGTIGQMGPPGLPGEEGEAGLDGMSGTGPRGIQGATGATGPAGPALPPGFGDDYDFPEFLTTHPNISDSDCHIQYLLLAGRNGGQTARGGTATGDHLTLLPHDRTPDNTNAGRLRFDERIVLWPTMPASITGAVDLISLTATTTLNPGGINGFRLIDLSPTVTVSPASGVKGSGIRCLRGGGTYTMTSAQGFDSFQFFLAAPVLISATTSVPPISPSWFLNQAVVRATANNVGTMGFYQTFDDNGGIDTTTNASAAITLSDFVSFISRPTLTSAPAGAAVTVTQRRGLVVQDMVSSGAGTRTLSLNVGIDILTLTQTSGTPISLRSQGSSVEMRHAGPGVFGANAAATNASVALEVQSTTKAFLLPRMTTTQRDAIATIIDGMVIYNTTAGQMQVRDSGTWVSV